MKLESINLYRMTHLDNIPHILQHGITHKLSPNANPNFRIIGDLSLIQTRASTYVTIDNGELINQNNPRICLGDCIPFYFGVKMPMLYIMQNGGNCVSEVTDPQNIIYLACSLSKIVNSGITYYFSNGHGTNKFTSFYDSSKIQELPSIIDWAAVKATYWGNDENQNLKRKKQAEFLSKNDLDVSCIMGYGCYNDVARNALIALGVDKDLIKIIPQAYY